jgi:hypothetical protein
MSNLAYRGESILLGFLENLVRGWRGKGPGSRLESYLLVGTDFYSVGR